MRILTPTKKVVEITKVEPFTEARIQFNGKEARLCQITKNKELVSGLYFSLSDNSMGMFASRDLVLGNLKREKADEIMQELLTQGYADLSDIKYQENVEQDKLYVFDNGETLPYYVDDNLGAISYSPAREDMPVGGNAPFSMGTGIATGKNTMECDDEEYDEEDEWIEEYLVNGDLYLEVTEDFVRKVYFKYLDGAIRLQPMCHGGMFVDSYIYRQSGIVDFRHYQFGYRSFETYYMSDSIKRLVVNNVSGVVMRIDNEEYKTGITIRVVDRDNK